MEYHDHILDHYHNPKNHEPLRGEVTHKGYAKNPTCGDELTFSLVIKDGCLQEISWQGSGCAISQASASLLSQHIHGATTKDALALAPNDVLRLLELPLSPGRLKCGILSLETLHKALQNPIKNNNL
jgi:nitrogen fixation protein NifU and related proteins